MARLVRGKARGVQNSGSLKLKHPSLGIFGKTNDFTGGIRKKIKMTKITKRNDQPQDCCTANQVNLYHQN